MALAIANGTVTLLYCKNLMYNTASCNKAHV